MTIYVRGDDVSIELDGKHLVTTKAHYPNRYSFSNNVDLSISCLLLKIIDS